MPLGDRPPGQRYRRPGQLLHISGAPHGRGEAAKTTSPHSSPWRSCCCMSSWRATPTPARHSAGSGTTSSPSRTWPAQTPRLERFPPLASPPGPVLPQVLCSGDTGGVVTIWSLDEQGGEGVLVPQVLDNTLYTEQCALNTARFTLNNAHCTSEHCTLYTVYCILYTVYCTVYSVHCTLYYTVHCTLYTVHTTLYTAHCTLYTVVFRQSWRTGPVSPSRPSVSGTSTRM